MKEASMELTRSLLGGGTKGGSSRFAEAAGVSGSAGGNARGSNAGDANVGVKKQLSADELRRKIDALEHEKEMLLTENDIPVDYMDMRYNCRICKDTGITDTGQRCSCYEDIVRSIQE